MLLLTKKRNIVGRVEAMSKIIGVILAGGLATRMGGQDKGLLQLHGQTILDRVVATLTPQVDTLLINANGPSERFDDYGLPVISDSKAGFLGPLAGVLAGMEFARAEGFDWVATVAADTPFFPQDFVHRCQDVADNVHVPVVLASSFDAEKNKYMRHPTFGLWHVSLIANLTEALDSGVRKIVLWTDSVGGSEVRFDRDSNNRDPFFNVNTPQDLDKAIAMESSR